MNGLTGQSSETIVESQWVLMLFFTPGVLLGALGFLFAHTLVVAVDWVGQPNADEAAARPVNGNVEIDILEKPRLDDRINYALHWDGYGRAHKSKA